jgi:ABC-type Na+ efflux pump permease subunit
MSFLIIAAIIPSMLSLFYPIADKPWMKPIPFLGQSLLANDILGGVIPPVWMFVAAAAAVLVVTAVFLWLATRLFDSENIIVGR